MLNSDRQAADEIVCKFYDLILPEEGPYAAYITGPRRRYNKFAPTKKELWEIIKPADEVGYTVYHACAAFREARHDPKGTPHAQRRYGRTKKNVRGSKAFWLDVDAGPGKPYIDWRAAAEGVVAFCKATSLPIPLGVLSGLGLHIYWPLEQTLGPEIWERYARGLQVLCVKYGLHVDPARTADIASVLRTPGTHHRKEGVRQVQCGPLVGPFRLDTFDILLEYSGKQASKRPSQTLRELLGEAPEYIASRPRRNLAKSALIGLEDFDPAYSEPIAERCEQVRELRDKQGKLREPIWYAGLGVLAFCEDGAKFAHEWSSGDDRYTPEKTQEKLERARQLSGATTCRRFHYLNREVCERCTWWEKINSPIVLGRQRSEPQQQDKKTEPGNETRQEQQNWTNQQEQAGHTDQKWEDSRSNGGAAQSAFPLRWHGEENPNINQKWLVKQLLSTTGIGLISGQWSTGKTFVAIDLAASVMMGTQFAGRPVKRKGGVLFIAAEGAVQIPIRLCGIETKLPGHTGKLPFAWAESCPKLMAEDAIGTLEQIAKEAAVRMQSEFGVELVLIIVDTMSAAAGFKDENSSSEGQIAMNVLNELSTRTGALVMACDHFGKAVETGTRGTSAKEAAADVVIACLGDKTQAGNVTNLRIAVRKLRMGATGAETPFKLRTVDLGVDEDHEPITTCVVEWSPVTIAAPPEAAKGKGWPKSTTLFRSALVTMLKLHGAEQRPHADGQVILAVELDKVREEFDKRYPLHGDDRGKQLAKRRQSFKRSMQTVQSNGLIGGREIDGTFMVWLTRPEEEGVTRPPDTSGQQVA